MSRKDEEGKIRIHADVFYEPPQRVEKDDVVATMLKDDRSEIVSKVASWLGLKRVGFVYSHPVRDEDEVGYRMSAYELLRLRSKISPWRWNNRTRTVRSQSLL